jgi:hypothetical protein
MAEPATAAAPVAPAVVAAPPVAAAPVPVGGIIPGETFVQTMERLGGFDAPPSTSAQPAPAATPEPAKPAGKAKGKGPKGKEAPPAAAEPVAPPVVDKAAALAALAAELGYDFEPEAKRVTVAERVAFREAQKKAAARIEQQEQELLQNLNQAKGSFEPELAFAKQLKTAHDAGDYESVAKLLGANDWNGLQEAYIAKISDPNYKRLQLLEQKEREREQQVEQQRIQQQRQAQAQAQAQALQQHTANLSAQMQKSADPLVRELHDDPQFIRAVIEVQRQNWDGSATVSPEKAIKIAAQGFAAPLEKHMRGLYEKLQRAFGATPAQAAAVVQAVAPTAAAPVVAPAAGAKGKANRTGVVPTAPDVASAPKVFTTKKEKDAEFSRRLREAINEENLGIASDV